MDEDIYVVWLTRIDNLTPYSGQPTKPVRATFSRLIAARAARASCPSRPPIDFRRLLAQHGRIRSAGRE